MPSHPFRQRLEWSHDELVIALAACPRGRIQHYSSFSSNVAEVADLLSRTRGSVSMHFANFFSLRTNGERGFSNAGRNVREVFRQWDSRPEELGREANRLRLPLQEQATTPRIESTVSEDALGDLQGALEAWVTQFEVPVDQRVIYTRKGSIEAGIVLFGTYIWNHPDIAADALTALFGIFGRSGRSSFGAWLARRHEELQLADSSIRAKLPDFELFHLNPGNRRHLALVLSSWKIPRIRLTDALRKKAARLNRASEIRSVRDYLQISVAGDTCIHCLALLKAVIDYHTG